MFLSNCPQNQQNYYLIFIVILDLDKQICLSHVDGFIRIVSTNNSSEFLHQLYDRLD